MNWIQQWFRRRALTKSAALWQRGFDFATNEIQAGHTVDELDAMQSAFDRNEFDAGMSAGVHAWMTPNV